MGIKHNMVLYLHPRKDSQALPRGELHMDKAIHAKKLILQEKLPEQGELIDSAHTSLQLLPCRICNRKFVSERLEKHVQVCKKAKQSHRQVYNSCLHRFKGTVLEEYVKTHSRAKTPEVEEKKNLRQNRKANTRNLHAGRHAAGTSQWSK
ncbi:zinc finger C2HC domain-containing protein 1C-like [Symphorus nematophorus]